MDVSALFTARQAMASAAAAAPSQPTGPVMIRGLQIQQPFLDRFDPHGAQRTYDVRMHDRAPIGHVLLCSCREGDTPMIIRWSANCDQAIRKHIKSLTPDDWRRLQMSQDELKAYLGTATSFYVWEMSNIKRVDAILPAINGEWSFGWIWFKTANDCDFNTRLPPQASLAASAAGAASGAAAPSAQRSGRGRRGDRGGVRGSVGGSIRQSLEDSEAAPRSRTPPHSHMPATTSPPSSAREGSPATPPQNQVAPPQLPPPPPTTPLLTPSLENIRDGLKHIHEWPKRDLDLLNNLRGAGAISLFLKHWRATNYSTAFSGINAPGSALGMLRAQLSEVTGNDVPEIKHVHAAESDPACQAELMIHPSAPKCIFTDLNDAWNPTVAQKIWSLTRDGDASFVAMAELIKSIGAVGSLMKCSVHKRWCEMKPTKIHVCALPCVGCVDGKMQGDATQAVRMAAWAALRLLLQEKFIIVENADSGFLATIFKDKYVVESTVIDASDRGLPQGRVRHWSVMIHRSLVLDKTFSLENVVQLSGDCAQCTWQVFLVASNDEKLHELKWAARRATSRWPMELDVALDVDGAFVQALTDSEFEALDMTGPLAFFLNPNPQNHFQDSSDVSLCTLIKDSGPLMSVPHRRWFTASELLNAQGFPTDEVMHIVDDGIMKPGRLYCSFNRARMARQTQDVKEQAGDTMPLPVCGLMFSYVFGFCVFYEHGKSISI